MPTVGHVIRAHPRIKRTLAQTLKEEKKEYFDKFIAELVYGLFVGSILVEFGVALFILLA